MKKKTGLLLVALLLLSGGAVGAGSTFSQLDEARDQLSEEIENEFESYRQAKEDGSSGNADDIIQAEIDRMEEEVWAHYHALKEKDEEASFAELEEQIRQKTDDYIDELKHDINLLFHHN